MLLYWQKNTLNTFGLKSDLLPNIKAVKRGNYIYVKRNQNLTCSERKCAETEFNE